MLETINYRTVINSMSTQDHLEVWSWLLGRHVSIGQTFTNPLRIDRNPNCFLREYQGILFLTDYKWSKLYNGMTCIHAVANKMNWTLQQASVNIYASLYLKKPLNFNTITQVGTIQKGRKSNTKIHLNPYTYGGKAVWTKKSHEYWKVADVKVSDLQEMNVFDIKSFYMNESLIVPKDLCFAYYFPISTHVKIYQPRASKSDKFIGTANKEDVYKTNLGHSKRLITKSGKDVLTLKNIVPEWEIWAFQNEGMVCSNLGSFDKTIIIYDNDEVGQRTSKELQEKIPNSECVYFTKAKDAYDTCVEFGIDVLKEELKNLL